MPILSWNAVGHYRKVVYLAQTDDATRPLRSRPRIVWVFPLEIIDTGYGLLASSLEEQVVTVS